MSSMLMLFLSRKGWLKSGDPGRELNVIMDNCSGQNKNNAVLRLASLLVQLGFFKKVNFIFYIVGHTKNMCDRWFNILKVRFRRSNIYSIPQLIFEFKAAHTSITVHAIKDGDFKDYGKMLNLLYCKSTGG